MNDQPDLFALPVEPADNEARQPAQVPETTSDTNDKLTATAPEPAEAAIAGSEPPALPPAASGPADDIPPPADYAARRYLEYAMSVVTGRALPSVADGQKPVQRRILYAMHRMGLYRSPKHVKSARVVGDVIGKYHPHGDTAIYDALVRMGQPWAMRLPVVDGHGNFGSLDSGPAAMRYTECRMATAASAMTGGLDENTVDFKPNYDGKAQEPVVLPSRFPNLLVNG